MNIPPGYITREKAERIGRNLNEGVREIADRLLHRLHGRIQEIAGERDVEAIKAIIKSETDIAAAEIDVLQQDLHEQVHSTEH